MSEATATKKDFYWSEEREPHFDRRKEIMEAHPEVKNLFGINPMLKWTTLAIVIIQLTVAVFVGQLGWIPFLIVTYLVGATIAQALFLAVHEITHNLAFKSKKHNNWMAFIANLPIVFPYAMSFKIYHGEHHWDQGKDHIDTDIPSKIETILFRGVIGKIIWYLSQILFYAFRPIMVRPIKIDKWQVYNILFQVSAMAIFFGAIYQFMGINTVGTAVLYLLLSMFFAGGLHPTSGHFISEHYVFHEGQETYSYYGALNKLTFNVGYHNEHHDFPNIPGSRLPQLKKMAPEFYDHLHSYNSWVKVIWGFIFNRDVTLHSRTKRK